MAKHKCPMAGISDCNPACKMYDEGQCGLLVGLKKIGEVADALGALKRIIMDHTATMATAHADKAKSKGKE